jgi:hypothetical protein
VKEGCLISLRIICIIDNVSGVIYNFILVIILHSSNKYNKNTSLRSCLKNIIQKMDFLAIEFDGICTEKKMTEAIAEVNINF